MHKLMALWEPEKVDDYHNTAYHAHVLAQMGVPARRRVPLAALMLSALEGAIMMARVYQSVQPLTTAVTELKPLLDASCAEWGG